MDLEDELLNALLAEQGFDTDSSTLTKSKSANNTPANSASSTLANNASASVDDKLSHTQPVPLSALEAGLVYLQQLRPFSSAYNVQRRYPLAQKVTSQQVEGLLASLAQQQPTLFARLGWHTDTAEDAAYLAFLPATHACTSDIDLLTLSLDVAPLIEQKPELIDALKTQLLSDIQNACQQALDKPFTLLPQPASAPKTADQTRVAQAPQADRLTRVLLINVVSQQPEHDGLLEHTLHSLNLPQSLLVMTSHHVVTDAWSAQIQADTLHKLYTQAPLKSSNFEYCSDKFTSYLNLLHKNQQKNTDAQPLDTWPKDAKTMLKASQQAKHTQDKHTDFDERGIVHRHALSSAHYQRVAQFAQQHALSITMPFFAIWHICLQMLLNAQRTTRIPALAIGYSEALRDDTNANSIGYWINSRVSSLGDYQHASFIQLCQQLAQQHQQTHAHTPALIAHINPPRDLATHPLFDHYFNIEIDQQAPTNDSADMLASLPPLKTTHARFARSLHVYLHRTQQQGELLFSLSNQFAHQADVLCLLFESVLDWCVTYPQANLSTLPQPQILKQPQQAQQHTSHFEAIFGRVEHVVDDASHTKNSLNTPDLSTALQQHQPLVELLFTYANQWVQLESIEDNWFDAGMHSLHLLHLQHHMQTVQKLHIPLALFIAHPSCAQLAAALKLT